MKKEKILQEIEETKKHLGELERLAKEEEHKGTWRPDLNQEYYCRSVDGSIIPCEWDDDCIDNYRYSIGNCFRTEEEAKFETERLKVIQELKRFAYDFSDDDWENNNILKYFMKYSVTTDEIVVDFYRATNLFGLHFESSEDIEDAIKSVGEDRIKRYYFGVK